VHRLMPNPLKYFGIEYSANTNGVHRRTLEYVIENNLNNLKKGIPSDYLLVGLLPSREAADWFIEQFNIEIRPQAQEALSRGDWQSVAALIEGLLRRAGATDTPQL